MSIDALLADVELDHLSNSDLEHVRIRTNVAEITTVATLLMVCTSEQEVEVVTLQESVPPPHFRLGGPNIPLVT